MYTNKERIIENEFLELENGTHSQLKRELDEAETVRAERLRIAERKRDLIISTTEAELHSNIRSANIMLIVCNCSLIV